MRRRRLAGMDFVQVDTVHVVRFCTDSPGGCQFKAYMSLDKAYEDVVTYLKKVYNSLTPQIDPQDQEQMQLMLTMYEKLKEDRGEDAIDSFNDLMAEREESNVQMELHESVDVFSSRGSSDPIGKTIYVLHDVETSSDIQDLAAYLTMNEARWAAFELIRDRAQAIDKYTKTHWSPQLIAAYERLNDGVKREEVDAALSAWQNWRYVFQTYSHNHQPDPLFVMIYDVQILD